MPRPKVHPDNRQRVVKACIQCKSSKRKCDNALPCGHCLKRDWECRFPEANEVDGSGDAVAIDKPDSRQNEGRKRYTVERTHTSVSRNQGEVENSISPAAISSQSTSKAETINTARPRMLANTRGERVFIGPSASLSFLQFLRETVRQSIGASEFSDYRNSHDRMLEADLNLSDSPDQGAETALHKQQQYLENYFLATAGVIEPFTRQEACDLFAHVSRSSTTLTAQALLIVAIGAQNMPLSKNDAIVEKSSVSRSQHIAFQTMLEDPSLEMIQIFTLLSFYMLGACRRNAAFMYLGVAARAAHALGLHHPAAYNALPEAKVRARLRSWKSLVTLDQIVASILGRAPATSPSRNEESLALNDVSVGGTDASVELGTTFRLCVTIDAILNDYYDAKMMRVEVAEMHLRSLRSWSDSLPAELKLGGSSKADKGQAQQLSSLQTCCCYYFAVMLVTRPFLISSLTQDSPARSEVMDDALAEADAADIDGLATACLNAAIFMAQHGAQLLQDDLLLENMCLLKAWTFAAGLVLGFQLFAGKGIDEEIEDAFISIRDILRRFSSRSPQAAHYLDILNQLATAITRQKQLIRARKRKRAHSFVDRIIDPRSSSTHAEPADVCTDERTAFASNAATYSLMDSDVALDQLDSSILTDLDFSNWDATAFAVDDQFSLDPQSLDGMAWNFPWNSVFTND